MMNMMGSSYPTSGGSLSQNQIQGGNNSLGSMGMLHDANDSAPYDMNDFPQLTGRPSSAGGPQGQYGSLRKQGVGVNTIVQQNQEFSIQNEDFPALPGYKGGYSYIIVERSLTFSEGVLINYTWCIMQYQLHDCYNLLSQLSTGPR
jgi:CCR4-NOT transcription complex subunit 2